MSADWSTRLLGVKVKFGVESGTLEGNTAFVSGESKVTTYIRAGLTVQAAFAGGLTMRLRFSRLGQRVSLPIVLTHDFNPYVLTGAIGLPTIAYLAAWKFFLEPRKQRRIAE